MQESHTLSGEGDSPVCSTEKSLLVSGTYESPNLLIENQKSSATGAQTLLQNDKSSQNGLPQKSKSGSASSRTTSTSSNQGAQDQQTGKCVHASTIGACMCMSSITCIRFSMIL